MAFVLTLVLGCDGNPKPPPVAEHTGVVHSGATTEVCAVPLEPNWPPDADPCAIVAGGLYFEEVESCGQPFWFKGEFVHAHFTFDSNWNDRFWCVEEGGVAHISGCFPEGDAFTFDPTTNLMSWYGGNYALVATDWQPHSGTTLDYYFYGYSGHYSTPSWCFPADSGGSGGP